MTVPSDPNDDGPRRLLQPAPPAPALPPEFRPLGGAAPEALRQLVASLVQTTLEEQFARFLGAGVYQRTPAQ